MSFDGGNILLGGGGSDLIIGGGGTDIIDGDAWLHVGLTSYTAGASIIRQINYDANGNTYDPSTAAVTFDDVTGLVTSFTPGTGHVNAANVDTAVFNDLMSNYNVALFGPDAEGFLTIQHNVVPAGGGGGGGGGGGAVGVLMTAPTGSATSSGCSSPTGRLPSTRTAT